MLSEDYHTTEPRVLPLASATTDDAWEREVQPRLPEWWETQAAALGAWTRDRQVHRPADLLRAILAYVLCNYSFRTLACWSVLSGIADISETAWRKRLQQAGDWLAWMLTRVVATGQAPTPWIVAKGLRRVILVDGTHLRCRGLRGLVARVHTAFDLLGGRLSEVLVTDEHQGEDWRLFEVQEGDLFISDRINGYQQRIAEMVCRGAHVLVRCSLSGLPLYDAQGKRIDLLAWLKGRHAPAGRVCTRQVWLHTPLLWVPLHLVALRLTQEQTQKAVRRKRKKATQDKSQVSSQALYGAGWLLIVSTLPQAEWNATQLLALYRARWQIELLFKRIKQVLDVHQLRCEHWGRARASLLAYLLCWALQEEELVHIRLLLSQSQTTLSQQRITACMPRPGTRPGDQRMDAGGLVRRSTALSGARHLFLPALSRVLAQASSVSARPSSAADALVFSVLFLAGPTAGGRRDGRRKSSFFRLSSRLWSIISVSDQQLDAQTRAAFYALAVFPAKSNSFSEEAALAVASCPVETLDQLVDTGLVQSSGSERYTLHQTIADYACLQLAQDPVSKEAALRRLITYIANFVELHATDYEMLERESNTLFAALAQAEGSDVIRIAYALTSFLLARGFYQLAETHLKRAYDAALFVESAVWSMRTLTSLGEIVQRSSLFSQAETYFQNALALARHIDDDEQKIYLLSLLGTLGWKQGKYQQAEAYLQEGILLARAKNNGHLYRVLGIMGTVESRRGNFVQAEKYMRESIELFRAQNKDDAQLSVMTDSLGVVFVALGKYDEAEKLFQEALALERKTGHLEWMCSTLNNIGDMKKLKLSQKNVESKVGC